ncbi:TetR/AcrR family transcriptional regulator [Serratia plymuthica]|uniref:TetR/AcrR family transcriptional regulator n=1 Tax=Serratia plymuthica TaxID=82996 RepID=UPI001BAE7FC7|nr:TetR/AcrR family transcriptional regulator [Serratia plymuthica]
MSYSFLRSMDLAAMTAQNVKKPTSPRRPGRPSGAANGAEKREHLLDTALNLFARQGIADTSLNAIAREAGVTPAMLHYYFHNREQLLDVLIDERFLPVRIAAGGVFDANEDDPVAAFTELAQRFIDISIAHPWFAPLWLREVMSDSGVLKQRMDERFGDKQRKTAMQSIVRWQKEGKLHADLEPSLLIVTLFGMTLLPLATASKWQRDNALSPLRAEDIARHAITLLTHGLGPQR